MVSTIQFVQLIVLLATAIAGDEPRDRVSILNEKLRRAAAHLEFNPSSGYLPAVLDALSVPIQSQVLVFSQTSSQAELISQQNPRAIYFNEDVAVGWVRGGTVLEIAAQDPLRGTVFYTLDQTPADTIEFKRNDACLSCHESGLLVRSTDGITSIVTDHRTPFEERWGGWYVTGLARRLRHKGNRVGQGWLESLYDQFDTESYPAMYSDIAALMVLEHQARMTNLITQLGRETSDAQKTIDELVDYMLFIDEPKLPSMVVSTSGFTAEFAAAGPYDSKGRSLRQFDLKNRLFRYPCSYMIYSAAFEGLPLQVRRAVYSRMWKVLNSRVHEADRQAIIEILRDTKSEFAQYGGPS